MQQQIQIEKEDQLLGLSDIINQSKSNEKNQDKIYNAAFQEEIQENIAENYQQDFDSISSHEHQDAASQIQEEYIIVQDQIVSKNIEIGMNQDEQYANSGHLQRQCKLIQSQISILTMKINQAQQQAYNQDQTESILQNYKQIIQQNKKRLQDIDKQQIIYLQSKLGKDSLSLSLLFSQDNCQQKIIEQVDKVMTLINFSQLQIAKIKRQIKRYEEALPLEEQNRQEFYRKYKKIKKQVEEKRERVETNSTKQHQLDQKLSNLKAKIILFQNTNPEKQYRTNKEYIKYKQLLKRKQQQQKRNNLMQHQILNNCNIISRGCLQIKKQNQQVSQKIHHLQQKNSSVEIESTKIMQKFEAKKRQIKKDNQSSHNDSQIKDASSSPIINKRHNIRSSSNNFSETKRFSNPNPSNRSLLKMATEVQDQEIVELNINRIKNNQSIALRQNYSPLAKLGQSSTSNTLRQFKLKLPGNTPQKRERPTKNLNISLDICKEATRSSRKDIAKMSITQRLERIQIMQRQDRIFSQKLYQNSKKGQSKTFINEESQRQIIQMSKKLSATPETTVLMNQKYNQSYLKKRENKKYNQTEYQSVIVKPEYQQQQVVIKPADTSSPTNEQINNKDDNETLTTSQVLRSHNKFFKKRLVYRQKKISEEYMRVLEQRGRKILELDNQSEC